MKIAVVGIGYVGLSNAILLSQKNEVIAFDVNSKKVIQLNNRVSPIQDNDIEDYLSNKNLNLRATSNKNEAYDNADFVIIATPTDYDTETNYFDTSSIEEVIKDIININPGSVIVIKSTVATGYTKSINKKFNCNNIIFSPEFLREGLSTL
jgi:UDPglucose 6-dehydrogenase